MSYLFRPLFYLPTSLRVLENVLKEKAPSFVKDHIKKTQRFSEPSLTLGFVQHVSRHTHCHSHTLDLVLSRIINNVDVSVFPHNPEVLRPKQRIMKSHARNSRTTQRFLDALPDSLHLPKDVGVHIF